MVENCFDQRMWLLTWANLAHQNYDKRVLAFAIELCEQMGIRGKVVSVPSDVFDVFCARLVRYLNAATVRA